MKLVVQVERRRRRRLLYSIICRRRRKRTLLWTKNQYQEESDRSMIIAIWVLSLLHSTTKQKSKFNEETKKTLYMTFFKKPKIQKIDPPRMRTRFCVRGLWYCTCVCELLATTSSYFFRERAWVVPNLTFYAVVDFVRQLFVAVIRVDGQT